MADLYWVQPATNTARLATPTHNVDVVVNHDVFGLDAFMVQKYLDALNAASTEEETAAACAEINGDPDIQPTVVPMGWVRAIIENQTAKLYGQNLKLVRAAALTLRGAGLIV